MAIELPKETGERLVESIKKYFREELDEELGDLRARLILDFVLVEIGPSVYNLAIADAQTYFHEKVLDLDGSCYEPEMTFWMPDAKRDGS